MESILGTLTEWMRVSIYNWGYFGIFIMMAIGSACIPLPSEIVMVYGGYLVIARPERFGSQGMLWMGIIGALGCVFGSVIAYWVGKYGGRPFITKYGRYFLVREKDLDKADIWFVKHGAAAIFFGRMLPVVRAYISFPAGIADMPFVRFIIYTFIGSLPWCIGLAYVGKVVAGNLDVLKPYFHKADAVIVGAAVVMVVLYVYHHIKSDRDYRKGKNGEF